MRAFCCFTMFLARLCLSAIFILSGINKIVYYRATESFMLENGMTLVPLFLILSIVIEVLAGIFLLVGYKPRGAALLLALYLIPVTYVFHHFWDLSGEQQQNQMINFLKNLAIFGGLLSVACAYSARRLCSAVGPDKTEPTLPAPPPA